MDKFTTLEGVAAPLKIINVDTDMVIPKQYLKTIKRTGLGKGLFSEQRYKDDGSENPDFILNKPAYRNAKILVAGDNFGCGSSREHAPWALLDFGIRCVISTSFGDIFYNNCFKNGILPIRVTQDDLDKLFDDAERGANATLSIDLANQEIRGPDGGTVKFEIDAVPQALPDERSRRHRPHHGEEGLDRRLRGQGEDRARLGLILPRQRATYAARRRHLLAWPARSAPAALPEIAGRGGPQGHRLQFRAAGAIARRRRQCRGRSDPAATRSPNGCARRSPMAAGATGPRCNSAISSGCG